ncbi:MAG: DNA primase [Steroidobacteraceae bacterium]|nr:DNA primase [Steroidobacteraceae bacterium]
MAGRIPQHFIDDLIGRTDIVELIGSRVPLKKAGREFKACCPFHDEKSPSFWVSPDKQFYHCFGCGAHGTALGFLMNYDRLSFPEAVEELASRAGVEVPREGGADERAVDSHDALYELNARVAKHFAATLAADARAQAYVARRGLDAGTVARFQIGFATNSWNDVLRRFGTSATAVRALAGLGLVIEREGGEARDGERHYDRFRDRLMFPIRDARGRTIAFGGRVIGDGEPKYLNSPETALFHKGRELYGLYEVRQSRVKLVRLLVVEGYIDVVRLHQAGVRYAVATLGTATTPEHLKRIFRLVREVVFAFDGDRAGRAAAWRALQNSLPEVREGREIRFLFLPEGHDPDTLVAAEGADAFEARLGDALPLSEYLVRELATQADLAHADGRARFAELARPLIARVGPGVYRELLVARVAEAIRLPADRLAALWRDGGDSGSARGGAPRAALPTSARSASDTLRRHRRPGAAGRRSLVGQAVQALLHFPSAAATLDGALIASLSRVEEPGVAILRELLDELVRDPARSTAQILERWRERPEGAHLARLAADEALVTDAKAAGAEVATALARLAAGADKRRVEALLAKSAEGGLSNEEKQELQGLMAASGPRPQSVRPH